MKSNLQKCLLLAFLIFQNEVFGMRRQGDDALGGLWSAHSEPDSSLDEPSPPIPQSEPIQQNQRASPQVYVHPPYAGNPEDFLIEANAPDPILANFLKDDFEQFTEEGKKRIKGKNQHKNGEKGQNVKAKDAGENSGSKSPKGDFKKPHSH